MIFQDKVVWITGAGSGLGKAMALEFAKQGAHLVLSGRRENRLITVANEVNKIGAKALCLPCDVTDQNQIKKSIEQLISHFSKLDVVVANAGFSVSGRIEQLTTEDWERQFQVNVFGLVSTIQSTLPYLEKTKGRIALIGSGAAWLHIPKSIAYCASKASVHAIGQSLSIQLHKTGMSCTTIHPGYVESEIAQVNNSGIYDNSKPDRRPKNLMWTSQRAAMVMVKAIAKRKRVYVFTKHAKFGVWLARFFPTLTFHLLRRFG
jgi:NADP-dependent 3-hydroxy acid dehydrogenase YdfG